MSLCINICCCNRLFGEGLRLLAETALAHCEPAVRVCDDPRGIHDGAPDLVIVDYNVLSHLAVEDFTSREVKILLLGTSCIPLFEEGQFLNLIAQGITGILSPVAGGEELRKAVDHILAGQIWLSRRRMGALLFHKTGSRGDIPPELTRREQEVVQLICKGLRNKEIVERLHISEHSVKSHISNINSKFGVSSRLQLAIAALRRWPHYLYEA